MLQDGKFTTFTVSELFRDNKQGGRGVCAQIRVQVQHLLAHDHL